MLPAIRKWASWIYPIAALAIAIPLILDGEKTFEKQMAPYAYDLSIDWGAAHAVVNGYNPYTPEGLKFLGMSQKAGMGHPPTSSVWLLPLGNTPLQSAKAIWNELTILLLFLHLLIVATELKLPSPLATIPLLFGLVLSTSWMSFHLLLSQSSELIAFLLVLAWYHLRHGRELSGGFTLGLAATVKFYPGVVILYLLLARRYRAVAAAAAGWAIIGIPITWRLGISSWRLFLEQTEPYAAKWMWHLRNSSIQGIFQRLHFRSCLPFPEPTELWQPGKVLAAVTSLALFLAVLWVARRAASDPRKMDLPFALFTLVSLITGPYMWEHYNVTLILPCLLGLAALIAARRSGLRWPYVAAGAATLALVAVCLGTSMHLKSSLRAAWLVGKNPPSHLWLHVVEVASWAPTPLLIILLGTLLHWSQRRAPAAFDRLALPPLAPESQPS